MSCVVKYKGKEYSEEDFKVIASVHEKVKSQLKAGGLFKQFSNKLYYSKFDVSKINKENSRIAEINSMYVGKIVTLKGGDREVLINVNPIADTILSVAKQSTIPNHIQGQFLFQKLQENKEKNNPNSIITSAIKSFLQKNNINLEYLDSIKAKTGEDSIAAYDTINRTILVAEGKEDLDTLPEETGHTIVETLGVNHPLVKSLLFHVSKLDYKAICGSDYVRDFQNNQDLLIREAAAKLIGEAITGKVKTSIGDRARDIITKLIHSFLNLFTKTSSFKDHMKEALNTASKLADKVYEGEVFDNRYSGFQDQPTNQFFFQKDKKRKEVASKSQQEHISRVNYISKKIKSLEAEIKNEKDNTARVALSEKLNNLREKFSEYKNNPSKANITEVMRPLLYEVEQIVGKLETGEINIKDISVKDILFSIDVIDRSKLTNIATEAIGLEDRLDPLVDELIRKTAEEELGKPEPVTVDDINTIENDINFLEAGVGALVDKHDQIGSSIGSLIKKTQNKISRFKEKTSKEVDEAVTKLKNYQHSQGVKPDNTYDIFIQDIGSTTVLTRKYNSDFYADRAKAFKDAKSEDSAVQEKAMVWFSENFDEDGNIIEQKKYENKNFQKIQSSKELKEFYDFYKKKTEEAFDKLPVNGGEDFIANIRDKTIKDILKSKGFMGKLVGLTEHILEAKEVRDQQRNTELDSDEIPLKYLNKVKASEKTKDLGATLLTFSLFADSHNEMSEILPLTRLMQEKIGKKEYRSSTNPNNTYIGTKSNIYKLAKTHIDIQVKGETKKDLKKISYMGTDADGNPVEKFFDIGTIIDIGVKYNSLLRIGFNPFLAVSNVIVGDVNNFIEGIGGRFFNVSQLTKASGIYYQQIYNKDSKLNKIHKTLKVLRQLEDYQPVNKDRLKEKWSWKNIEEWMYKPQSRGELFIQSRAMTASMLHDTITDNKGVKHSLWEAFDEKGEWKKELFGELTDNRIGKISSRIQRIIEMGQGRYSQEDAAAWSQNAIFRAAFQFKKWIPAAVEARMDKYGWDIRLGEYNEGRWRTGNRLIKEVFSKDPDKRGFMDMISSVFSTKKRLEQGGLSELEVANIRKNLIEITIIAASIVLAAHFLGSDYRKKHKDVLTNPGVKFAFDQLNRISGDLAFFTSPGQLSQMATNLVPLIKTTSDIGTCLKNIPYTFGGEDATYKKGSHVGENKFYSKLFSLIPVVNPIYKVKRNFNKGEEAPDYSIQSR